MRLTSSVKSVNHFSKFTNHFWSNINYFSIDYYFRLNQTLKNIKIIFKKLFYVKTNNINKIIAVGYLAVRCTRAPTAFDLLGLDHMMTQQKHGSIRINIIYYG